MGGIKNKSSKLGKLSNKAKTLLHMPHSLSFKERADEMTQSSQSGEVNKVVTLSIKPKSTLFYIVTSLVTIILLTILAISIKLSFLRAASDEGANDTGAATLNSVNIAKLGSTNSDSTSLTVTYSDGSTLSANKDNNEILNNDEVIYEASYNVTAPGTITLSLIMPANNVINEASISEASGCMAGSKVEKADITNSDGTITKSYTNNKATCIINPTTTGTTTWTISTNPWGGNNQEIQPTLAISGQEQTTKPEAVRTVGKGDYGLEVSYTNVTGALDGGAEMILYTKLYSRRTTSDGAIGILPIMTNGEFYIEADTQNLPKGWYVSSSSRGISDIRTAISSDGSNSNYSTVYGGDFSALKNDNGDSMRLSFGGGVVTGVLHCPSENIYGTPLNSDRCYYTGGTVAMAAPVESLTEQIKYYGMTFDEHINFNGQSSMDLTVSPASGGWNLSTRGSAKPKIWPLSTADLVGWYDFWSVDQPIYAGEAIKDMTPTLQTDVVIGGDVATNLKYCTTWNPSQYRLTTGLNSLEGNSQYVILSDYGAEYGVIGEDGGATPSSLQTACGHYGDGAANFFKSLEQAEEYARSRGMHVNAVRLWSAETKANVRDGRLGSLRFVAAFDNANSLNTWDTSAVTDQWDETGTYGWSTTLTPGLLSHTLTAIPSSTNPGKEDHITISTKTYNKDTNTKITTTLPNGLSPKAGSFTITTGYDSTGTPIKEALIEGEGQDYTIASSSDGGYTITFDLDHIATTHHVPLTGYDPIYPGESGVTNIAWDEETSSWQEVITTNNNNTDSDLLNDDLPIAADNDGNGIDHAHTPIEFDLVVNEDAPVPSTLTINSTVTGTGTSYASTSFKTASDTIAIANPPATFGYDLTATPSNIYAGDSLTYNYSISNTTKDPASNITMVSVLPYNGDSRGTTGLKEVAEDVNPYIITNLSLSLPGDGTTSGSDTSTTKLYYTLDPKARDLESADPEALGTAPSITWQELDLDSDGTIPSEAMTKLEDEGILTSITALKLTTTTLPSGSKLNLEITLDSILATTPGVQAKLASDITYLTYSTESNSINTQDANTPTILLSSDNYTVYSNGQTISTHQNPITINYLGELLALSIPEDEQSISITTKPGTVLIGDPLINHLSLTTGTLHGYTLTMQTTTTNGALTNKDQTRTIPTIPTKPTTAQAGWSATIAGSNNPSLNNPDPDNSDTYTAIPGINQTPLNLYTSTAKGRDSRTLTITYGVSVANTIADTYSAKVVYTVVGEP